MLRCLAGLFCLSCLVAPPVLNGEETRSPTEVIDLLEPALAETFVQHLNEKASLSTSFPEVWTRTEAGNLRVTGKGLGYLRTRENFRDYHLVCEYRWSERTFSGRADRARDGGILLQITGEDGAFHGTWAACLQAQLIEGGSGDMIALPTKATPSRFESTASLQDLSIWTPDGETVTFPLEGKSVAHLGWRNRSENWKDVKGFRGELDVENPPGNWNRLEVIAHGDTLEYRLNGEVVNRANSVFPNSGGIGLQTEFAAYEIRRMELHPLNSYKEKWSEAVASTDMGYSITGESILPRELPLSPTESQRLWEIDGDYEIELVAAEPLTCDPVDVVWDAQGRMFVAEMGDYPLPVDEGDYLSRIRLLKDQNGDGVMDEAVTWAENLDHVQGLLPLRDGILATTRTAILFLRDTNGDDRADERTVLFESNEPRHNQLQISSPRWGLDHHIYFSNGLDGKQIYPADDPDKVTEFTRLNLRYDPRSGAIKPATGVGQYGGTIDAFGRHFFCSNRNPAVFAVMPLEAVRRNLLAAIQVGHEDIQPQAAPVRPIALSHTTSSAHAGTHTAACGLGVYTGDLLPDLRGDLFVCDPTAQLVTRNHMVPAGASFVAERVGDDREFLASGDEWARPVQVRNGPDGALYIVDMYRRFIDHSRFFPEDFAESHYMRAGFDQGRIWRLVPKGKEPRSIEPLPDSNRDLVSLLDHPNNWHRTHAQRLLLEQDEEKPVESVAALLDPDKGPEVNVRALWTLVGWGELTSMQAEQALQSDHSEVVENAVLAIHQAGLAAEMSEALFFAPFHDHPRAQFLSLCLFPEIPRDSKELATALEQSPENRWLAKAILSSEGEQISTILPLLVTALGENSKAKATAGISASKSLLQDYTRYFAATVEPKVLDQGLSLLEGEPSWWRFAMVTGLSEGLRQRKDDFRSLSALTRNEATFPAAAHLTRILTNASEVAQDATAKEADRIAALSLVAQLPLDEKLPLVEKLIDLKESPAIQAAACQTLSRDPREKVADFFFARWQDLAPTPRREALTLITSNTKTGLALMRRMEAGEISPSLMPPMTRWSYGRSSNEEIKNLAQKLFGQTASDRAELISQYRDEIQSLAGDSTRGKEIFAKAACITCHEFGGTGVAVGPSLDDIKAKPPEAILTDILDPNRAVEERWTATSVQTRQETVFSGILSAEDAAGVTVRMPGGSEQTISRQDIVALQTSGLSLMPVGLEAALPAQDMADLIAYLKER